MNWMPLYFVLGPLVTTVALATSGFTTQKLAGSPAAFMLLRYVALFRSVLAADCGFGFSAYICCTSDDCVQPEPVYFDESPAAADPLMCARKIGSGLVPGAPV